MVDHASTTMEENVEEIARLFVEACSQLVGLGRGHGKPFIHGSVNGHLILFTLDYLFLPLLRSLWGRLALGVMNTG